jgi:polar amino acid transport system substrate-binding protein
LESGVLKVGMEIGYPPMEYLDEDGKTPIGFDVEMAGLIAKKLGLKLELKDTAWSGIFDSLDSKRYDCVISSVSITDERKNKYNLTEAYVANKLCLVTAKDLKIKSPDDLGGYKVAVQTDTTADVYMKAKTAAGLKLGDYKVYDKIISCFDELKIGRIDAVLVDSVVASYYIGDAKDTYSVVWENTEAEPMAIALKKGNDELTKAIDKAVDEIYADGSYKTIADKYFGEGNTVAVRNSSR